MQLPAGMCWSERLVLLRRGWCGGRHDGLRGCCEELNYCCRQGWSASEKGGVV